MAHCVNRSLPEFKELVKQTGMNPVILAAKISIWQEQNGLDAFPTAEQALAPIIKKRTPKELAKRWNIKDNGFTQSNNLPTATVNQMIAEAKVAGFGVRQASSGAYFFTRNGTKVNPWKNISYQLESKENREAPKRELEIKLQNWAKKNGIDITTLQDYMERIEQNPNYDNGVIGLADLTNKIIAIADGKADISTLPEEAAHFAIELLREDPSVQRALAQVVKTEEYLNVKREYADVYTTEMEFRKEALGKILAQEIINKDQQETNKPVRPFLKAIMDKLIRAFRNIFKRPTAREEIQKILQPLAKQMLDGKVIGDAKMLENPETSKLYQKEVQVGEKIIKIDDIEYTGKPSTILSSLRKIANNVLFKEVRQEDGKLSHNYIDVKTGKNIQPVSEFLADNIEGYGISEEDAAKPIVRLAGEAGTKIHNTFNSFFNNVDFGVDAETKKLIKPQLEELYLRLEDQFDTLISEVIVSNGKTAGTIDLVGIKDGKVTLIDFKSMTMKGYENYSTSSKGQLSKKDKHTAQLSKYSELFEEVTGVTPTNLTVIPMVIDYSKTKEGPIKSLNIEDAISIKESVLPKDEVEEESEATPEDIKKERKAKIRFLEKAVAQLENRLEIMTRAVKKKESSRALKLQIIKIQRQIEEGKLNAAISSIINNGLNELDKIETFLDIKREGTASTMTNRDINNIVNSRGFGLMYRDLISVLKKDMYDFGFTSKDLDNVKGELDAFQTRVTKITDKATGLLESITVEKLREGNKDMYGNILDPTFDPASVLEKTEEDISWWRMWMGSLKNSRSTIIKIAAKKLNNILNKVHRFKVEKARDLLELQKLAEKEGKIEDLFEKDSTGKRTGYLISEYNIGQYYENLEKFKEKLAKRLGKDYYGDIVKEDLSKEELAIYNLEWKGWFKENKKTITEIKVIDGVEVAVDKDVYADKYKNPEFKKLSGNMKKYYDKLIETKREALKKQPADYLTDDSVYLVPQIRRTFLDRMTKAGSEQSFLKSMKEGLKGAVLKEDDDTMFGEVTKMNTKVVPIFFNTKLQNMAELTYDLTASYTKYAEMAENYNQMNTISGEMQALLSTLEDRTYIRKGRQEKGASSREYRALEEFIDYTIYGKEKEDVTWKVPGTNKTINASKFLEKITSYLRTNNLALNLTTSVAGYFKGTMDSVIEDQIGIYTTNESKNWARAEIYRNIPHVLTEIGNTVQTNKMHLILENNNVIELDRRLKNSHKNRALRKLINHDTLFTNYQMADYFMKGKITLAVYDNYRLIDGKFMSRHDFINMRLKEAKVEGKERVFSSKTFKNVDQALQDKINAEWKAAKENNQTLYDAYETKGGKLVVKEEFKNYISPALENVVHNRINHITHITDGTISAEDRGAMSRKIWGDLALMHRGWVISGIDNRLKLRGTNFETEQEEVGYYRAFGAFLSNFFKKEESGVRAKFAAWEKLSDIERKGVKKTILDLAVMNAVAIIAAMLNNLADDDEDENFYIQYMAYQSNRVLLEAKAFWSPKEFLDIMDEPVAGARIIGEIAQLSDAINFYEDSRIKSGMYKDWTKGGKYWAKRVTPFKNIYELQYPAKKNRFIKSILDSPTYAALYGEEEDRSILSPIRFLEAIGAIGSQSEPKD